MSSPKEQLERRLKDLGFDQSIADVTTGLSEPEKQAVIDSVIAGGQDEEEIVDLGEEGVEGFCDIVHGRLESDKVKMTVVQDMVKKRLKGTQESLVQQAVNRSQSSEDDEDKDNRTVQVYFQAELKRALAAHSQALILPLPQGDMRDVPDVGMDKTVCVCDDPILTTGLATCIALGLTVQAGRHRYNAMHHYSGGPGVNEAIAEVESVVNACKMHVETDDTSVDFSQATYFAVGGSIDTLPEQIAAAKALSSKRYAIVSFDTGPTDEDNSKTAYISEHGGLSYGVPDDPSNSG